MSDVCQMLLRKCYQQAAHQLSNEMDSNETSEKNSNEKSEKDEPGENATRFPQFPTNYHKEELLLQVIYFFKLPRMVRITSSARKLPLEKDKGLFP
jgi:hypothetical protein